MVSSKFSVTTFSLMLLSCISTSLFSGCGNSINTDYSSLNLATAYGTVSVGGVPVVGATVIFEAEDKTYSSGVTDASGSYVMMFNSEKKGVTPGPKIVRISYQNEDEDGEDEEDPDGENGNGKASEDTYDIPPKYNSKSEVKVVIEPGSSHEFDFDLID